MQNGFASPNGTLGTAGFDLSMTRAMIPKVQEHVVRTRTSDAEIIDIDATRAVLRSKERFHGFVTTTHDLVAALRSLVNRVPVGAVN